MTEEQAPISPEATAAVKAYLEDIVTGKCPTCHQPVQQEKQVGRCVYALPCWHRMYQGKAKPKPEKIHPYLLEQLEQERRQEP